MKNNKFKEMKINDDVINIELNDGTKVDANILFTFNENGDQFIFYEIDDVAYGAKVKDDDSLIAINDDEWELVEKIFNEWLEEQDQENEESDN
ncbi:MAG: DUF1292 domain-containing protein [Mycoplasma sp.]|nr:DUF1292 domain-containing protein [Mycoplasma sp.]